MRKTKDILDFFEKFAPVATAMDFDNCGLLAGSEDDCFERVLVALDITPEVVSEAKSLGCGLIISHHPVIFSPIKRLDSKSVPYLLAAEGIAAICMHTNLDLSEEFGVNVCLAKAAGVSSPRKSNLGECLFFGELENEIEIYAFAKNVKDSLGCEGLRYTDVKKSVKRVAVSSGAGGSEVFAAAAEGADVLVTGEIKHHEINSANGLGISIVDAGHFKSEDVVILPLIKKLEREFDDIVFTKSKSYTDNIKFL